MDFLLNIVIAPPADLDPAELDRLKAAEGVRAAELAAAGHLHRLWRDPERWANWGLWSAADEQELMAAVGSLPLYPFMDVMVHPLIAHPNDPAGYT